MGLLDLFRRKALSASPAVVEALQDRRINPYPALGGTNQRVSAAYQRGMDGSYGWMYATQPAVRSVIDYVARNVAQLGLKLYERVSDDDRRRREDHPAAETMDRPNEGTTGQALIYRLVTDYLIWDNAYLLKFRGPNGGPRQLVRLPPSMVAVSGGRFEATQYVVWRYDGTQIPVRPEDIVHWFGYNPDDPLMGLSKLETLRLELAGDRATQAAMVELAKNGLKGGYIKRPLEAPEWDDTDAKRFAEEWRTAKRRGDGSDPILEEGMEFEQTGVTPKDAMAIDARQFTKAEVASIYGVPLSALSGGEGNKGNMEEVRKLVYTDVLPPITESLSEQLDKDLLLGEYNEDSLYFEFDLNEKLRGDPESRFAAITSAVGRPWLLVDEARARENLPSVDGGDELTVPLNVQVGDAPNPRTPQLPAPNVMPPQDPNKPPADGSHRESLQLPAGKAEIPGAVDPEHRLPHYAQRHREDMARQRRYVSEAQGLLYRFYGRQARSSKSAKAFDSERWNRELSKDLREFLEHVVEVEGSVYVGKLGGSDFDMRQVQHYLDAMAEGTAEGLNAVTQRDLEDGADALDRAMNERAAIAGASIGARATVFARTAAARQSPDPRSRTKTWLANTKRHASLQGATVSLESDWGGISPGSEANCACSMSIT